MPAGPHLLYIGLLCLELAGCAPSASVAHEGKEMQEDGITRGVTIGSYTYTDAPVDARIGRHLYRIPANYFYDQMGPTFQGDVSLRMQWPDLTPMPPGQTQQQTMSEFMKAVNYDIYYVDRVDIRESMRRAYSNGEPRDSLAYRNPEDRLDLRIPQPESMGLVRYDVDPELVEQYAKEWEERNGYPYAPIIGVRKDWYVARDETDEVVTFIKCDTDEVPDTWEIQGRDLVRSDDPRRSVAQCNHLMIFPEESLSVSIGYVRLVLSDWQRFEGALKELLGRTRVD